MNIKPPSNIARRDYTKRYVFLAGSIEQGKAINWQAEMELFFNGLGLGTFNPRRDDWNPDLVTQYESPEFYQQVLWEKTALDAADIILLNFCSDTLSPISLLELGLYAASKKISVVCPRHFWRSGNIQITCSLYHIPLYETLEEFKDHFNKLINDTSQTN